MKTGAVIVAAGMSSRMNDFKPMMQLGSLSLIQRVISTFQLAGVDLIVVVTGNHAKLLEQHLSEQGVVCIYNQDYETTQMFDSAKLGLSILAGKCDRIFFTPADIPLFTMGTINRLLASQAKLVKPVHGQKAGHPILIDASLLPCLLSFQGEGGMKGALREAKADIERILVDDEGILMDADTQEDLKRLMQYESRINEII